jgi:hypothetical protein
MEGEIDNHEQDRVMEVAPDGDVVLVVGQECLRLMVSSQCLRAASKIFSAMLKTETLFTASPSARIYAATFEPDVSRGKRVLLAGSKREVLLPDDHVEAMRIICCVLHLRNDMAPSILTVKEILQIAVLVRKYELQTALKHAILDWLKPRTKKGMRETGLLLAAATLVGNPEMIKTHTETLVLEYTESYDILLEEEAIVQIMPTRGICK